MLKERVEMKMFNMRLPAKAWLDVKVLAAQQNMSMTQIFLKSFIEYKKMLGIETKVIEDEIETSYKKDLSALTEALHKANELIDKLS